MLLHDPFAGHRHWETGEPLLPQSDVYWTSWDYALADAATFIQDHTDKHGHLVWEAQSDRVDVVVESRIDKHDSAVERVTNKKDRKAPPGEYFVGRLELIHGDEWPTWEEWAEKESESLGNGS